ncbi:MAG TPA: NUDIX domain-containing protein [Fimbriimonadaceae bacterium]|nr:NUDIX domain-containing protein [Fimbriimonadaceae bacterium]
MKRFPSGKYGRQTLQFYPAPFRAPLRAFAALVWPWMDGKLLLCDIDGRGWCIPSGRVEPYETSCEAVRREALEEAGAVLGDLQYIGCHKIIDRREERWADVFAAHVLDLVEIGLPKESLGRRLVEPAEMPQVYHVWNPMTEMVLQHSLEVLTRTSSLK